MGCTGVPQIPANSPISTHSLHARNTGLIGGYIKVEIQKADLTWQDVTAEILNYGISGPADDNACNNGNPNAILQLQRVKNTAGPCLANGSQDSYDYWPNVLFDTREGTLREADPNSPGVTMGGLMHYVALDVGNLNKWLKGVAPYGAGSGVNALSNNGYGVYFSDRRNNRRRHEHCSDNRACFTAQWGDRRVRVRRRREPAERLGRPTPRWMAARTSTPTPSFDIYGMNPSSVNLLGQARWNTLPLNGLPSTAPLLLNQGGFDAIANVRPWFTLNHAEGMVNRPYLFRRALKLVNGGLTSFTTPNVTGLTVVTENPVYIQGDWNWNATAALTDPHAETAVIADAVTLLSTAWTDTNAFLNPA